MIQWAEKLAEDILQSGEQHVIATGVTPSGPIHIGNLREIIIADVIRETLTSKGAEAKLICVADTYDPLRKIYPFLPKEFAREIGKPLSEIPDPYGCCPSYAIHFLEPFLEALDELSVDMKVYKADEMYKQGLYDDYVEKAIANRDEIANILYETTHRKYDKNWSPFKPICESCGRIDSTISLGYRMDYQCDSCGYIGSTKKGKLVWRVDWPVRWIILDVTVEPFGKDHAVAGGSYDSAKKISREIFGRNVPYPIPFEHIHLRGKGKMSSSKGTFISAKEILDVIPPEVLRKHTAEKKPWKHVEFDPGSIPDIIDAHEQRGVPFRHMVNVVQIARDFEDMEEILKRNNYEFDEYVVRKSKYAKNWVENFAPEHMKFEIQQKVPKAVVHLSNGQRAGLALLAKSIKGKNAEELHKEVYRVAERVGIKPKNLFEAIYISLLGKQSGPRAGWLLSSMDKGFLRRRFIEASTI